jgi:ABC-type uncharacterized transport system permease subunit
MQRDAGVPSTLVAVVEALLVLTVVATQALRRRRPGRGVPSTDAAGLAAELTT